MPVVLMKVQKEVPIPENVKVTIKARRIWVEGPRGKLFRDFRHAQVTIKRTKNNTILVEKRFDKKKRCAVVKTLAGHIANLFVGVTQGFRYKMKLVYAHFPINATLVNEGKGIELRNYIGQKLVRKVSMRPGCTISAPPNSKDEYYIEGNDIDAVSGSASQVWQSCRVTDKDIRKFLDGVYVYAKGPINEEQPI
mmetsp:Transcript_66336/g.105538  ORF Transcript_66336/g.105538 Transcript_66336/m.105538 type:complete len:194 (+) Transcript_66336:129-710(+)|eukprot:CAMPEP_0197046480 /NCGR_PEP_ID=MMETSP1384-20130603/22193_1 /TAXON_ID=29189 /ORGANISM="Ammonia sp." /LENGTH=193 /DNA_ID=CAMNT_0042478289 /DNA_START=273 /DNA_END=854 /DNA_ORIENTATION=+